MKKLLSVIHSVGGLKSKSGGPSRSVPRLCESLGKLGVSVTLISLKFRTLNDSDLLPSAEFTNTTMIRAISIPIFDVVFSRAFRKTFLSHATISQTRIIHDHGLWLPSNHTASAVARQLGIPFIISPRGMLEPWALRFKAWKKRLAWKLYQHKDILSARVLHATSFQEAKNFLQLGLKQPIAVIPNGINFPEWKQKISSAGRDRTALFLSRVHPVKGLMNLVAAWERVRPKGWQMIVAGPDEGNHRAEVEAAVRQAGLDKDFQFVGPVDGKAKEKLYQDADLFILPTYSENFGVVVAEALAYGVPVITTRGAPWADLETYRCGWWINTGVDPLVSALSEATSLTDAERQAMGERGRAYVQRYDWGNIAQQTIQVYRWVLGQGPKPDCVQTD